MNTQRRQERRRYVDTSARITYAASNIVGNTKLCQRNGYAHIALLALGFIELMVDGEFALMQAPEGVEA